jgi:hypothetical protein
LVTPEVISNIVEGAAAVRDTFLPRVALPMEPRVALPMDAPSRPIDMQAH